MSMIFQIPAAGPEVWLTRDFKVLNKDDFVPNCHRSLPPIRRVRSDYRHLPI
jgi:hypothetical protein